MINTIVECYKIGATPLFITHSWNQRWQPLYNKVQIGVFALPFWKVNFMISTIFCLSSKLNRIPYCRTRCTYCTYPITYVFSKLVVKSHLASQQKRSRTNFGRCYQHDSVAGDRLRYSNIYWHRSETENRSSLCA